MGPNIFILLPCITEPCLFRQKRSVGRTLSSSESTVVFMESLAHLASRLAGCGEDGGHSRKVTEGQRWCSGSLLRMLVWRMLGSGDFARRQFLRNSVGEVRRDYLHDFEK